LTCVKYIITQILIVDDEENVRNLFAACLSERYPCSTASSADEALARQASEQYALVVTDMLMPGRSLADTVFTSSKAKGAFVDDGFITVPFHKRDGLSVFPKGSRMVM
jgi:CheY-like chemotaxis protein